jgi:hypothetical protein
MTCCSTYDELLSSMSAGSVRLMSPGMAAMSVPPAFGAPASADGAVDGAVDGSLVAPSDGGAADGALLVAALPHAATMIAVAAMSAPMRVRIMSPPSGSIGLPPVDPPGLPSGTAAAATIAAQDRVGGGAA